MTQPRGTFGDGCLIAGTPVAVLTPAGAHVQQVENLRPGDTLQGINGPVRLVSVEPRDPPPGPGAAIQVLAGAIGPGRPDRDLLVSPEQLVFVQDEHLPDGALAPAGALVNGRSILRTTRPEGAAWYAVALESHGLLFAANLPLGSQREAGVALSVRLLPPGPGLFALRGRLTRAAAAAPPAAPAPTPAPAPEIPAAPSPPADAPAFIDDTPPDQVADLRLVADGHQAPSLPTGPGGFRFSIPAGAATLRLLSPVGYPPDRAAGDTDARRFGVAIQSILLDGIPLDLGGMIAGEGFHELETREHQSWRWTDGDARLVLPPCAQPRVLDVQISDWHRLLRRA